MRTGLLIADFEHSFTTSFKHTARVKYGVDFTSSNIYEIKQKLGHLKRQIQSGISNSIHVGYDFGVVEVEHIENLLAQIIQRYIELFDLSDVPNKKVYDLFQQLRDAEQQQPKEIVTEALKELLSPPKTSKLSKKEQFAADVERKKKERALDQLKKNSAKKNKK